MVGIDYICIMVQTCNNGKKNTAKKKCCAKVDGLLSPRFFKALCDPNRIAMLAHLSGYCEPLTVSEVAKLFTVDISVVSRHLSILREAGILEAQKQGKKVFYFVNYSALVSVLRNLADAIEACCPNDVSNTKEARNERKR